MKPVHSGYTAFPPGREPEARPPKIKPVAVVATFVDDPLSPPIVEAVAPDPADALAALRTRQQRDLDELLDLIRSEQPKPKTYTIQLRGRELVISSDQALMFFAAAMANDPTMLWLGGESVEVSAGDLEEIARQILAQQVSA